MQSLLRIFRKLTSSIKKAELRTSATESSDISEVEISIHAGNIPSDELEHALATGKNHVRHGKNVYLLTRELKEKTSNLQRRISGNPDAPLLARSSHQVANFRLPLLRNSSRTQIPAFNHPVSGKKKCRLARSFCTPPPN